MVTASSAAMRTATGLERRSMPHQFRIVLGLLIVCLSMGDATFAESDKKSLAVVSAEDAGSQAFADLLSVELSRHDDVSLVERDRIQAALSELKLNASGLVAAERQVEFGKIIAADVVLLVEQAKSVQPPSLHITCVETRTGLQLTSVFVRAKAADELERVAKDTIREILQRSHLPEDKRLYVGVAGVHSDEPGQTLTPVAQALTACLIHDLQRSPGVFVLERRHLRQLTAERDLTGIDLALKSSAILVEVGLGRDERGTSFRGTIRLTTSSGQAVKRGTLETETIDFPTVRHALSEKVVALLGGTSTTKVLG
ncbi:MAG: CsgG/HfaB family protein, partial [Planctomycetota bacterium]